MPIFAQVVHIIIELLSNFEKILSDLYKHFIKYLSSSPALQQILLNCKGDKICFVTDMFKDIYRKVAKKIAPLVKRRIRHDLADLKYLGKIFYDQCSKSRICIRIAQSVYKQQESVIENIKRFATDISQQLINLFIQHYFSNISIGNLITH